LLEGLADLVDAARRWPSLGLSNLGRGAWKLILQRPGRPCKSPAGQPARSTLSLARLRRPRPRWGGRGLARHAGVELIAYSPLAPGCSSVPARSGRPGPVGRGFGLPAACCRGSNRLLVECEPSLPPTAASMAEVGAQTVPGPRGPRPNPRLPRCPRQETAAAAVGWRARSERGGSLSIARRSPLPRADAGPNRFQSTDVSPVVGSDGEGVGAEDHRKEAEDVGKLPATLWPGWGRGSAGLAGWPSPAASASAAIADDRRCWGPGSVQGCLLSQAASVFLDQGIERGPAARKPRQFQKGSGHRFNWPRPPRPDCCERCSCSFEHGANEAFGEHRRLVARPDPGLLLQCSRALLLLTFLRRRVRLSSTSRASVQAHGPLAIGEGGADPRHTALPWSLKARRWAGFSGRAWNLTRRRGGLGA